MLIPQKVTPTDNVTVQNNNNGVLSIKFWLPSVSHCAYGKETDSSAKENTKLQEGLNVTEFLLAVEHFYNFTIYTVMYISDFELIQILNTYTEDSSSYYPSV
jgi:hypothetical protein